MKIYLCGPMTHYVAPDLNRGAFRAATTVLRNAGHQVFDPIENPDHLTYAECMRVDIQEVLDADAIVTLPRWREGVGTRVEVGVALAIGIPVYDYANGALVPIYSTTAGREHLRALLDGDPA